MFKTKIIIFSGILCASLYAPFLGAMAQVSPQLNLQNSGSMGFVPTNTRPLTSNRTNDLSSSGASLTDQRNLSVLGCGALDTNEARKSVLNIDDATIDEMFATELSNYMVTTLFNSPAVAQIFNSLESFSSARVRELQDRCAAMEYKDDLAPAQWAAVQLCMQNHVEDVGNSDSDTVAQAFKMCLSSPDYVEQTGETFNRTLFETTQDVLQSDKWNGTLFSALKNTRICVQTTFGKDCSLMSLLPNIRWCTQTNIDSFGYCDDGSGTTTASANFNISPESLSPVQLFDGVFGATEPFIIYAITYADMLINEVGFDAALEIATRGENAAGLHVNKVATPAQVMAGFADDGSEDGPGEFPEADKIEHAFSQYMNCSGNVEYGSGFSYGVLEWEDFNDTVVDASITAILPPPLVAGVYGDKLASNFGITFSESSDSSVAEISPTGIIILQNYAVKCAMTDDIRLTLADYVSLMLQEESKDAALMGYRTQVAYTATRNVMRFLIHRLQLAQIDLGMNVVTDPNAPPPYVRNALQTLIDSFESRLQQMEERRKQQRDYAVMIAAFRK